MTGTAIEDPRWSPKSWLKLVGVILASQLLLIFALSQKTSFQRKSAVLPTRHGLAAEHPAASPWAETLELKDPTLLAGANPHGFSGTAWLQEPEMKYVWTPEPDRPDYRAFQNSPMQLLLADMAERALVPARNDDLHPTPALAMPEWSAPPPEAVSVLELEGSLAARGLGKPIQPPAQHFNDALTNSVVQVAVNDAGLVMAARLLAGSGSKKADQDAIALAKALRFNPLPRSYVRSGPPEDHLEWGKLNFQWFTLELVETNKPVRKP